jgi:hypothetical protein
VLAHGARCGPVADDAAELEVGLGEVVPDCIGHAVAEVECRRVASSGSWLSWAAAANAYGAFLQRIAAATE